MPIHNAARAIAKRLHPQGQLTILTGAGISAESGVPTFRDFYGLWQTHRWQDLATPEGFERHPEAVLSFYNTRRQQLMTTQPNGAHMALADAQEWLDSRLTLITQNVDDLHERAGSTNVLHMHGELGKKRCCQCSDVSACTADITLEQRCACCNGGPMRPHIVWFGEIPFYIEDTIPRALGTDVFLSVGTSGTVYPAAGFVNAAKSHGALTVTLNLEQADNSGSFDLQLLGKAGEVLPMLLAAVRKCTQSNPA